MEVLCHKVPRGASGGVWCRVLPVTDDANGAGVRVTGGRNAVRGAGRGSA